MPLLSVLTPATGNRAVYVKEAGVSLAEQELPKGWEIEWVVQEDGPTPILADVISDFPFATYEANKRQLGAAETRNIALRRVQGELVHVLDCDDVQLPGGLAEVLSAFHAYADIHWVSGQADNLLSCGTRVAFAPLVKPGYFEAGELNDFALAQGRYPIMQGSVTARTASIRALGGWPGVMLGEDALLLAALTDLAPGYYSPKVTWLYRKHEQQTTRDPYIISRAETAKEMVLQRIKAIRQLKLQIASW